VGDFVLIDSNADHMKKIQKGAPSGYSSSMKDCCGLPGIIMKVYPDGQTVKVLQTKAKFKWDIRCLTKTRSEKGRYQQVVEGAKVQV